VIRPGRTGGSDWARRFDDATGAAISTVACGCTLGSMSMTIYVAA
jgi:hypothetical protein